MILKEGFPEPHLLAPCLQQMIWMRENRHLLQIMVSFCTLSNTYKHALWLFDIAHIFFTLMDRQCTECTQSMLTVCYNYCWKHFSKSFDCKHCFLGLSEMVTEAASSPGPFRNTQMSKAAQTHKLRKLRAPSKCRECDSLVVFHGAECEEVRFYIHTHGSLIKHELK